MTLTYELHLDKVKLNHHAEDHFSKVTARTYRHTLTYKVLTTTQPLGLYVHNFISVQRPCSTRSASVLSFARPSMSSSLTLYKAMASILPLRYGH